MDCLISPIIENSCIFCHYLFDSTLLCIGGGLGNDVAWPPQLHSYIPVMGGFLALEIVSEYLVRE